MVTAVGNSYDVQINDGELQHIDIVAAKKALAGKLPEIVEPPARRSPAMIWLDCLVAFLVLTLPASFMLSEPLFIVNLAAVLAIVLCGYLKIICLLVAAMAPPDTPHVVAIIKAPDRMFCPRCGEPKTKKYCSGCGVNTEKAYRKLVRQLGYYAVEDTKQQRLFLESSLKGYLENVVQAQQAEITTALKTLERNYVMEIVRQRKALRVNQLGLMPPSPPEAEEISGNRGFKSCTF